MVNTGFDVTDSSTIYLFGNFASSHTDESFNFRSSYADPAGVAYPTVNPTVDGGSFNKRAVLLPAPVLQHEVPGQQPHLSGRRIRAGHQRIQSEHDLSGRLYAAVRR